MDRHPLGQRCPRFPLVRRHRPSLGRDIHSPTHYGGGALAQSAGRAAPAGSAASFDASAGRSSPTGARAGPCGIDRAHRHRRAPAGWHAREKWGFAWRARAPALSRRMRPDDRPCSFAWPVSPLRTPSPCCGCYPWAIGTRTSRYSPRCPLSSHLVRYATWPFLRSPFQAGRPLHVSVFRSAIRASMPSRIRFSPNSTSPWGSSSSM